MVNGLRLYLLSKVLYNIASHSQVSPMQGSSQQVGSSWGADGVQVGLGGALLRDTTTLILGIEQTTALPPEPKLGNNSKE